MNKQCCAYNENKRCSNLTNEFSNHCKDHYFESIKLYKKYKKICNVAYSLDINKTFKNLNEQVKYLFNCYKWLMRAFDSRLKHRNYSFVPECYDDGHNLQFKIIKDKINVCEQELQKIYEYFDQNKKLENNNINDNEPDECFDDDDKKVNISILTETKQLTKNKLDSYTESKCKIEEYIKENNIILEIRSRIINLIIKLIISWIPKEYIENKKITNLLIISTIHLIENLSDMNYFDENFKPNKCRECDCNEFIPFTVKLLCCECVLDIDVNQFLNSYHELYLKNFYGKSLLNSSKINPLIKDYEFYLKLFDLGIINLKFDIIWDNKKNRLILKQSTNDHIEKSSKFLSKLRYKEKHFNKIFEEDDLYD